LRPGVVRVRNTHRACGSVERVWAGCSASLSCGYWFWPLVNENLVVWGLAREARGAACVKLGLPGIARFL